MKWIISQESASFCTDGLQRPGCWLFCVLRARVLLLREAFSRQRCAAYIFHVLTYARLHTHAHFCWYDSDCRPPICLPSYLIQGQSSCWHLPFQFIALLILVFPPVCVSGAFLPWQQEACIRCTVYLLLCWILQYSFKIAILFNTQKNQTYYLTFVYCNPSVLQVCCGLEVRWQEWREDPFLSIKLLQRHSFRLLSDLKEKGKTAEPGEVAERLRAFAALLLYRVQVLTPVCLPKANLKLQF